MFEMPSLYKRPIPSAELVQCVYLEIKEKRGKQGILNLASVLWGKDAERESENRELELKPLPWQICVSEPAWLAVVPHSDCTV